MGDFWAESIHLASPATERFYAFWDRANLDSVLHQEKKTCPFQTNTSNNDTSEIDT